ncbi:hypothetical protein KKB83_03760 [Patescibacteria group bacterium]|nr:hypothetical protein [Patescibacteria group bacterium]
MAEAFYNHITKSNNASSAGTDPNTPSKYPKLPDYICQIMAEENIDVSRHKVKLINEHFMDNAKQIFVMCSKELCPDFLVKSNKVTYWEIDDPYKMGLDDMRKIRDQIKAKVQTIL